LTLTGLSATGDSAGAYTSSESVERSVNSVSRDVSECVEMRRLLFLALGAHADGGGAVGSVGNSSEAARRWEAEVGPAITASQVLTVVSEHSETGRIFVDTAQAEV